MPGFRILISLLLLVGANSAVADTSWFFKLTMFRFAPEEFVKPQNGEVDLTRQPADVIYQIQGDALFFPGEFMTPTYLAQADFEQLIASRKPKALELNLRTFPHTYENLAPFGTVIMRFKNTRARDISLQFPRFYHPMDVYVVQPDRADFAIRADRINPNPEQNRPVNPFISSIPLIPVKGDFLVWAHLSSPLVDGQSSINLSSFYVADEVALSRMMYYNRAATSFVIGSFFIIFVFYSFIYVFRMRDISSFYLSVFALSCFFLSCFYAIEFDWPPSVVLDRFTIIDAYAICFLLLYLLEKIKVWIGRTWQRRCSIAAFSAATLATLCVLLKLYLGAGLIFVALLLGSLFLILMTIYLGLKHGMNGLGFFVAGTIGNAIFQTPIMIAFIAGENSENGYIIVLANFVMTIGLALVNAKEFAVTYKTSIRQGRELERFNRDLEKLVSVKTKEIQSLLDHIPQGVLSIGKDGIVSKDYSAHLSVVIGKESIALRSFKELILDASTLSADMRDQAWQTILASIGEPSLNFELNSEKLPTELALRTDPPRWLKVTWNVEVEGDVVQQILVTLLDITHEKSLEEESLRSRQELRLIEELVNVSPSKAAQFFLTSTPLLEENQRLVNNLSNPVDPDVIRTLFVNAHTVKGAARTLLLKDLASAVHHMEEYYSEVLHGAPDIDIARLRMDIELTLKVLQAYREVNRMKLGRQDDFAKVAIERDFIEKHYYLLKDIIRKDRVNVDEFMQCLREHSEAINRLIFEHLPAIFDVYKDKAAKISRDVGKAVPRFAFEILPIWVPPTIRTALDYSMIHILRNSMDHGIESSEERQKAGKHPEGLITVHTRCEDARLRITIEDDGRGLAMDKLRERGLKQGFLHADSTPAQIAEVIFAAGVTTTDRVSMVSGRGMGMDAVRSFLKKAGAEIQVRLGDRLPGEANFRRFQLEISLPWEA